MKRFLRQNCSRRFGYDGWAVRVKGRLPVMEHTVSTTRAEARGIKSEMAGLLPAGLEVVKVRIKVEAVDAGQ